MIASVVCFLLGICTLHLFPSLPSCLWIILGIAAVGLVILLFPKLKLHYLLAYGLGFLWVTFQAQLHLDKQLPEDLQGVPLTVIGTIANLPEFKDKGDTGNEEEPATRFEFDIEDLVSPPGQWSNLTSFEKEQEYERGRGQGHGVGYGQGQALWKQQARVRLHWKKLEENLVVGDKWQLRIKLKRPRSYSNPG